MINFAIKSLNLHRLNPHRAAAIGRTKPCRVSFVVQLQLIALPTLPEPGAAYSQELDPQLTHLQISNRDFYVSKFEAGLAAHLEKAAELGQPPTPFVAFADLSRRPGAAFKDQCGRGLAYDMRGVCSIFAFGPRAVLGRPGRAPTCNQNWSKLCVQMVQNWPIAEHGLHHRKGFDTETPS
jgi:hypothetical protein